MAGTIRPTREAVNAVAEQIARGDANPQPFPPYITPYYREHPRLPASRRIWTL